MDREKKKALIKSNIVEAAFHLLETSPFDLLSINNLCQQASVSKRTFYSYFESKEELYLELVYQTFEFFNQKMKKALAQAHQSNQALTGIDQLTILGSTYLFFHIENEVMGKIILTFAETDYEPSYPDHVNRIRNIANRYELSSYISSNAMLREALTPTDALSLWAQVHGMAQLLIHKKVWLETYYKLTRDEIITSHMNQIRTYLEFLCKGERK